MKKFFGIAMLLMAMAAIAFASPTGSITNWFASNEEDNYVNPQWYPGVEFSKFFATAGFMGPTNPDYKGADLGFATRFGGSIYLGAHYNGNIFKNYDVSYTEVDNATFANNDGRNYKWYSDLPDFTTNVPNHDFSVLLGIADMGFLLSIDTNYQSFKVTEDTRIDTGYYKSYELSEGYITPGLKWGMARNLLANGIRPAVGVTLGINNEIDKFERYEPDYNQTTAQGYLDAPWRVYGEQITSSNWNDLGLSFNLGGYTLVSTEGGFNFSADLDYNLLAKIYGDSEYTMLETDGTMFTSDYTRTYKKYSVKGRSNSTTSAEVNITDSTHTITPSVSASWGSERIVLGAKLELPVEISSEGYTTQQSHYTTYVGNLLGPQVHGYDEWRDTGTYSKSGVEFSPVIKLGAQYRVVPNRFFINMGAEIGLSSVSQTSETTVYYIFDASNTNSVKTDEYKSTDVSITSSGTTISLKAGMTFYFTDNVFLDAYTEVAGDSFNIFGAGAGSESITSFSGIILGLKF
jgi:hypothetical protein